MADDADIPRPEEMTEEGLYVLGERLPPPEEVRDRKIAVAAVVTALGALAFGLGLLLEAPRTVYGGGLAVALLALALGFRWYFTKVFPDIEAVEPRPGREEAEEEPLEEVPEPARRSMVGWLLGGAAGLLGLSFLAPVTALGPRAGNALRHTEWREGARLVTTAGRPVRPADIPPGGVVTVWPEHAVEHERSAVMVLRLAAHQEPEEPTNPEWVVDGAVVAYSKVCTHAGCPVGLFREDDDALFCPCHLATFDAARAAEPTFGPAPRRLPQLPLGMGGVGELVALGDFVEPIGPPYGWLQQVAEERRA
jgi:ubiquinol-cytochrome c reductase iron-sulfur subunit